MSIHKEPMAADLSDIGDMTMMGTAKNTSSSNSGDGYGTIATSLYKYFTPKMMIWLIMPLVLVIFNWETAVKYFLAGGALNVVILACLLIAMGIASINNKRLRSNAFFLKRMGEIIDGTEHGDAQVQELLGTLSKQGNFFDTNHMVGCIKNIERFGHPNFTDTDARMIKSKLGQRLSERRRSVSFIGGLLVMLGLIGTYMGLLFTIDSVGGVMMQMSNIGSDDADAMSGFIGALAEPLQGMGLAFSSSLFGIGSSLLVQVYNNFCSQAQNEFIENVSRWIDDRIPKFTQADKDKRVFGKAASADDLRTWLAGFVNLSVQTNRKMGQLVSVLNASSQASIRSARAIDQLMISQKNTHGLMEAMSSSITELSRRSTDSPELTQMGRDISDLKSSAREISSAIPSLSQALQNMNAASSSTNNTMHEGMLSLGQTMRSQSSDVALLSSTLQSLPDALTQLAQTQNLLLNKLETMQGVPSQSSAAGVSDIDQEMSGLSNDLNHLMEQMNVGNSELFDNMFAMDDDDDFQVPELDEDDNTEPSSDSDEKPKSE